MLNADYIERYVKERDKLLHNIDVKKYKRFCKKWGIPHSNNDLVCLASMHKARLGVTSMTKEEVEASKKWLTENGFLPYIKY